MQKYEPYFPRVLHINNPFTSLHQFTAKPEPAWKNYQKGDYEKAIDIFSKELKLSKHFYYELFNRRDSRLLK